MAAKAVLGGFPKTLEGLRALPGVGPYTAGAIASIALGQRAALVDGNVERVLARVGGYAESGEALRKRVWAAAEALVLEVPEAQVGDLNQALMELGATVCRPKKPACAACPVGQCVGRGEPERYPVKQKKAPSPEVRATALVRVCEGRVWLGRRPPGLLGGLWEPPIAEGWADGWALQGIPMGQVTHVFSHRRLIVDVRREDVGTGQVAEGTRMPEPVLGRGAYVEEAWVTWVGLADVPLSALAKKVLGVG